MAEIDWHTLAHELLVIRPTADGSAHHLVALRGVEGPMARVGAQLCVSPHRHLVESVRADLVEMVRLVAEEAGREAVEMRQGRLL